MLYFLECASKARKVNSANGRVRDDQLVHARTQIILEPSAIV